MSIAGFVRQNAAFLGAGAILTFLSSFGQTFFISVFAGDIRAEFRLGHGAWGTIYATGTLASAAVMLWAGGLTDRVRVRVLGPAVLVGLALACLAMALVPGAWALPLAIFGLRFFGQGMAVHIGVVAVARWFNANRGKAISIAVLGVALGEAILPMSFAALRQGIDWRWLWAASAVIVAATIPVLIPLLRMERTPQAVAEENASAGMDGRHWSRREMAGMPLFWLILPALLAPPAFSTAFFFQQVHIAEVREISHVALTALFPVFTLSGVASMLVYGVLIDRIGAVRLMPAILLPMAAGFAVFGAIEGLAGIAAAFVLMGITQGGFSTVPNAFWAEVFGTRHLGAIKALATAIMVLGTAIGPILSGRAIDAGIPFPDQTPAIALYFVLSSAMVWLGTRGLRSRLPAAP